MPQRNRQTPKTLLVLWRALGTETVRASRPPMSEPAGDPAPPPPPSSVRRRRASASCLVLGRLALGSA